MTGIHPLAGILLIFTLLISITSGNEVAWMLIKRTYNPTFVSSRDETSARNIFFTKFNMMNKQNILFSTGKSTFTVGMNKFSYMNNTEISYYKGYIPNDQNVLKGLKSSVNYKSPTQPNSDVIVGAVSDTGVDSRNHTCQRPIDDQGKCGSCYTFSTCHQFHFSSCIMNYTYFNNTYNTYAEQELVSCSRAYGNLGCSGGSMVRSYNYINASGIANRVNYGYDGTESSCMSSSYYDFLSLLNIFILDIVRIPKNNCTALEDAVRKNLVVSAAIYSSDPLFTMYTGGIYLSNSCNNSVDHAILIVGFTQSYWIIKNSWGLQWGMSGYGYIGRSNVNSCGLCFMASYVSLAYW